MTPAIDRPPLSSRSCNPFVGIHSVALTHDIRFGAPFPSARGVPGGDVPKFGPLAFLPTLPPVWSALVLSLTMLTEIAGILGPVLGSSRRTEGPFGKVEHALANGAIGVWLACLGPLPENARFVLPCFAILFLLTIGNRLRFAVASTVFYGES